jgi:hypothetical protein
MDDQPSKYCVLKCFQYVDKNGIKITQAPGSTYRLKEGDNVNLSELIRAEYVILEERGHKTVKPSPVESGEVIPRDIVLKPTGIDSQAGFGKL